MFYSHEILTSHKHGVATVWILATLGEGGGGRRVTRRAIEDVDVQKACGTIDNPPGAPIALRLQASLLYGVSRAYSQQCQYVLGDAERIRLSMTSLYQLVKSSNLDPKAGKAKRQQLMVLNDPDFDIGNLNLPRFEIDRDGNFHQNDTQLTLNLFSQLSPLDSGAYSSSPNGSIMAGMNLSQSPSVLGGISLDSPFGGPLSAQKLLVDPEVLGDEELQIDDIGLLIDADGNIVESPRLPRLPGAPAADDGIAGPSGSGEKRLPQDDDPLIIFEDDQLLNLGDKALPEANALPIRKNAEESRDAVEQGSAPLAPTRRKKHKRPIDADDETNLSRLDYHQQGNSYLAAMEKERLRAMRRHEVVTLDQARQNAYHRLFGRGIGGVGTDFGRPGLTHPLAEFFAGEGLQIGLLGHRLGEQASQQRRRHRTASEAFEEEDDERGRRKSARIDAGNEQDIPQDGQGPLDDFMMMMSDDIQPVPEMGREAAHPLSDQPSLPWHRQSSVVPGSSVKGSSAKRGGPVGPHVQDSPLMRRGSAVQDIERFSDILGSDGPYLGGDEGGSGGSSLDDNMGPATGGDAAPGSDDRLSVEGHRFLAFLKHEALKNGIPRDEGDEMWLRFASVFRPEPKTQAVAAQAFYQVLSLATNNAILVDQEGRDERKPFGPIHIGVRVDDVEADEDFASLGLHEDDAAMYGIAEE